MARGWLKQILQRISTIGDLGVCCTARMGEASSSIPSRGISSQYYPARSGGAERRLERRSERGDNAQAEQRPSFFARLFGGFRRKPSPAAQASQHHSWKPPTPGSPSVAEQPGKSAGVSSRRSLSRLPARLQRRSTTRCLCLLLRSAEADERSR